MQSQHGLALVRQLEVRHRMQIVVDHQLVPSKLKLNHQLRALIPRVLIAENPS